MGSMGKRRRRTTRSSRPGGRVDIDQGVHVPASTGIEPLSPAGYLRGIGALADAARRVPDEGRGRLYRGALPYIALASVILVALIALIIVVSQLA